MEHEREDDETDSTQIKLNGIDSEDSVGDSLGTSEEILHTIESSTTLEKRIRD